MHIILAIILAQAQQDEAALVCLEDWINNNKEWVKDNPKLTVESAWLQVRALSMMSTLLDQWLARGYYATSTKLREFHIERLDRSLNIVDQIFDFDKRIAKLQNDAHVEKLESQEFSTTPNETSECLPATLNSLLTWYVASSLRLADHQLQSPRYLTHYAPETRKILRKLLATRFGCIRGGDELAYTKLFRAENLRVYAQMQLQDAVGTRSLLPKTVVLSQLRGAVRATNLGLHLVRAVAEAKIAERLPPSDNKYKFEPTMPILERLAPVDAISAYEGLLNVRTRLQYAIEGFER